MHDLGVGLVVQMSQRARTHGRTSLAGHREWSGSGLVPGASCAEGAVVADQTCGRGLKLDQRLRVVHRCSCSGFAGACSACGQLSLLASTRASLTAGAQLAVPAAREWLELALSVARLAQRVARPRLEGT